MEKGKQVFFLSFPYFKFGKFIFLLTPFLNVQKSISLHVSKSWAKIISVLKYIIHFLNSILFKISFYKYFSYLLYCTIVVNHWSCSVVFDSVIPWTVAYKALSSTEFSRQVYCSTLSFPSPGDLPYLGIDPVSCIVGRRFTIWATREAPIVAVFLHLKKY